MQVLADSVGIPCRLVKGQQYTGSADVAMIFVKIDDGRYLPKVTLYSSPQKHEHLFNFLNLCN